MEEAARAAAEVRGMQASQQAARLQQDLVQLEVDQRREVLTLRQARSFPASATCPPRDVGQPTEGILPRIGRSQCDACAALVAHVFRC